jgi:hypothetical protein
MIRTFNLLIENWPLVAMFAAMSWALWKIFNIDSDMMPKNYRPFVSKHLTEEQWKKHRSSFVEYSTGTGKYKNFRGGTLGWLKREGLPPITAEMAAEMEKRNEKYENELVANGMVSELMDWRQRRIERRAVVEAIEVIAS